MRPPQYQTTPEVHISPTNSPRGYSFSHVHLPFCPFHPHPPKALRLPAPLDLDNMAQPDMSLFERANQAASFLKGRLPEGLRTPRVAIVCGSGLGGLADTVHAEPRAEFDYSSIPYFPRPTGQSLTFRTQDHSEANVYSGRTCWETGIRSAWQAHSGRADGWPCPVGARQLGGVRLLL